MNRLLNFSRPSTRVAPVAPKRAPHPRNLSRAFGGNLQNLKFPRSSRAVQMRSQYDERVEDSLSTILQVVPEDLRSTLLDHPRKDTLLEIVLDLGRRPEARFAGQEGAEFLRETEITVEDLALAEQAVGNFGADNRAGIEGTLHRISAIRNRRGAIVGLTCRVGRAISGPIEMVRDLLDTPNSILFLGKPGVGKTTVIREIARVLADEFHKRVVIVDSSNEIGGDGDVPHPAIGGARRMQVPTPTDQHAIMIEAVENHTPEVIIVDEIGNEAEALACRTIAERGVMLIGTAHGQVLENLIKNPSLSDLIGGIQCVTLGDDEARLRGTQKSVLERKAPPTFPLVVEMRDRSTWVTHWVEDSVDALLNGKVPAVQLRTRDASKQVKITQNRYDHVCEMLGGDPGNSDASRPSNFPKSAPGYASPPPSQQGMQAGVGEAGLFAGVLDQESWGGYGGAPFDDSDPYAWAQRLRAVPDKDALAEMGSLGYIEGNGGSGRGRSARLGLMTGGTSRRSKRNSRSPSPRSRR